MDGSKEPVPYSGGRSGPQPSSEGFAPWVVPSALLPQGDSLWLAHSAHVCGRLRGGEAGRLPTSWGYYSTIVRILQGGVAEALPGRMVLFWPAPSFRGGSGLADAVVPPAHPPTFSRTGGHAVTPGGNQGFPAPSFERQVRLSLSIAGDTLYPRRGLRPPHPAWGRDGASFFSPWRVWSRYRACLWRWERDRGLTEAEARDMARPLSLSKGDDVCATWATMPNTLYGTHRRMSDTVQQPIIETQRRSSVGSPLADSLGGWRGGRHIRSAFGGGDSEGTNRGRCGRTPVPLVVDHRGQSTKGQTS